MGVCVIYFCLFISLFVTLLVAAEALRNLPIGVLTGVFVAKFPCWPQTLGMHV